MKVSEALFKRRAIKAFDPDHKMSDEDMKKLFTWALQTPSSFNMQHWRIVAVTDQDVKQKLCEASWNQAQVAQASVTIVISADPKAHVNSDRYWMNTPEDVRKKLVGMIEGFYNDQDQLQRDEAIRSGSLLSMSLMLAAVELDYDSCPMIGFNPEQVKSIVNLPDDFIPVLLLPIGKAAQPAREKPTQLPISETVKLNNYNGPGL